MYLLDTNICIYIINKKPQSVFDRLEDLSQQNIGVSVVTLSELQYGVEKSRDKNKNQQALKKFISPLSIYPFDYNASIAYGKVRSALEEKGTLIGAMDLMIASHAIALEAVLVTNNIKEFRRVSGLRVENWL